MDRIFASGTTSFFGGVSVSCPAGKRVLGGAGTLLTRPPFSPDLVAGRRSDGVLVSSHPTPHGAGCSSATTSPPSGCERWNQDLGRLHDCELRPSRGPSNAVAPAEASVDDSGRPVSNPRLRGATRLRR